MRDIFFWNSPMPPNSNWSYWMLTSFSESRLSLFLSAILNRVAASCRACLGCLGLTYDRSSERSAIPSWFLSINRLNSSCRWNVFFSIMYWRHLSSKSSATTLENSSFVKWSSPSSSNWRKRSSTKLSRFEALDSNGKTDYVFIIPFRMVGEMRSYMKLNSRRMILALNRWDPIYWVLWSLEGRISIIKKMEKTNDYSLPGCRKVKNSSNVKLNESVRAASFQSAFSRIISSFVLRSKFEWRLRSAFLMKASS